MHSLVCLHRNRKHLLRFLSGGNFCLGCRRKVCSVVVHRQSLRTVFARTQKCLPACRCAMAEGMATRMEDAGGCRLAGGKNLTADFFVQQAYMDVAWKAIKMSIGSKERNGFPLEKDVRLSSGMMVKVRMQDLFRR